MTWELPGIYQIETWDFSSDDPMTRRPDCTRFRKQNKLPNPGITVSKEIPFLLLCSSPKRRTPKVAAQTRKPIEIDLTGIEIEGIKLFVQERTDEMPAMALSTTPPPPCAFCNPPPCVFCTSATSIASRR